MKNVKCKIKCKKRIRQSDWRNSVTLSVLFTALPSFNASAPGKFKANKSFYENFEYDGSATLYK